MKDLIGVVLIITGLILGLYVGFYLMFIKGIIQLIQGITPVIVASDIAWGLGKIIVASAVGTLSGLCLVIPGIALVGEKIG